MPKKDMDLNRRIDVTRDPAAMTTNERMILAAEEAFNAAVKEKQNAVKRSQLQVKIASDAQLQVARYGNGSKGVQEYLLRDVAARAKGIEETLMAELYRGLEPYLTATGHKMSGEQQLEVLTAIANPKLLETTLDNKATPAERLAWAYRVIEDRVYQRKNSAGADIGYIPGHFPQAWDANSVRWFGLDARGKFEFRPEWAGGKQTRITRMREKARAAWVDFIMPKLDRSRYVDGETGAPLNDEQVAEIIGGVWQTIASHGLSGLDPATAGGGQSSLAQQLAAHREIHFNSPGSVPGGKQCLRHPRSVHQHGLQYPTPCQRHRPTGSPGTESGSGL